MKSPYIALLESVFLLDSHTIRVQSSNPPCHSKESKRKKDSRLVLKVDTSEPHIVFLLSIIG